MVAAGILACLDGYMNIAMEQTEVRCDVRFTTFVQHAPVHQAHELSLKAREACLAGVRARPAEEQIWRLLHPGKQWCAELWSMLQLDCSLGVA